MDYTSQNALTLNSGSIKDVAGNNANLTLPIPGESGSLSSTKNFIIDTVSPTITITAKNSAGNVIADGATTNNDSLLITFTLSEAASNFALSDISVSGGQLSSFTSNSSTVYSGVFKPSSAGETTIDVAANKFTDSAGNNNSASSQFNWSFDNIAPSISTVALLSDNSAVEVQLSESAFSQNNGSGELATSDFQFSMVGGTASLSSTAPTALTKNGNIYTLAINLSGTPYGREQF